MVVLAKEQTHLNVHYVAEMGNANIAYINSLVNIEIRR